MDCTDLRKIIEAEKQADNIIQGAILEAGKIRENVSGNILKKKAQLENEIDYQKNILKENMQRETDPIIKNILKEANVKVNVLKERLKDVQYESLIENIKKVVI